MRVQKFEPLALIEVLWEDTVSDAKWNSEDDIHKAHTAMVRTVGFWRENSKKVLKLSSSLTEDGEGDVTCIPWSCIRKVYNLKRGIDGSNK